MRRLLLKLLRRRRLEDDLEQELAFHRERSAEQGNPIPLGSTLRIKEEARDLWRFRLVEDFFRDLQYAARSLVRQPVFSGFAIVALVVGIGLNVAVFTAFNAMALRPWPVRDPDRVVMVQGDSFSITDGRQIGDHARSFEAVALVSGQQRASIEGREVSVDAVSANYFDLLGAPLAMGRPFGAAEDRAESPQPVVILAYGFWKSQFGGDPGVVGRELRLNGVPFTVVGVATNEFTAAFQRDLWVPLAARTLLDPRDRSLTGDVVCCELVARIAKGVGRAAARSELAVIVQQLHAPEFAGAPRREEPLTLVGTRLVDQAGWAVVSPFLIAQVAVGAIFLLACANVGNLILARALTRDRELAVRVSLGAGRLRIVRQLATEGVLLAVTASAGILAVPLLRAGFSEDRVTSDNGTITTIFATVVDFRVAAYVAAAALIATLVCGVAPALQVTRRSLMHAMKRQSAQATAHVPLRGVLLGVQVALSVTVLVCAALLARGVQKASSVDLGFRSHGVSRLSVQLDFQDFADHGTAGIVDRIRDELRPLGAIGLEGGSVGNARATMVMVPAHGDRPQQAGNAMEMSVDGGYFGVLNIPIIAGRNFGPDDRNRDVVVVNEAFARRYWPGTNPVGRTIRVPRGPAAAPLRDRSAVEARDYEVVGAVRDAYLTGLVDVPPMLFRVHTEQDQSFALLVADNTAAAAAAAVRRLDARASVSITRLGDLLDGEIGSARIVANLASGLGVIALLLATIGVYGVIAYSVEGRRREIGIRLALGAPARTVIGAIIGRNARPLILGLAAGVVMSLLASKVLEASLYGVSRLDPAAYVAVLLMVLAAGVAASMFPARRAARIDPVKVLHTE